MLRVFYPVVPLSFPSALQGANCLIETMMNDRSAPSQGVMLWHRCGPFTRFYRADRVSYPESGDVYIQFYLYVDGGGDVLKGNGDHAGNGRAHQSIKGDHDYI